MIYFLEVDFGRDSGGITEMLVARLGGKRFTGVIDLRVQFAGSKDELIKLIRRRELLAQFDHGRQLVTYEMVTKIELISD